MQHIYALVLVLIVLIGLWIAYNPQCLASWGVEQFIERGKQSDVGSYELPY